MHKVKETIFWYTGLTFYLAKFFAFDMWFSEND